MSAHGYGGESVLSTLTAKILLALTLAIARMDFGVEMTIIPALISTSAKLSCTHASIRVSTCGAPTSALATRDTVRRQTKGPALVGLIHQQLYDTLNSTDFMNVGIRHVFISYYLFLYNFRTFQFLGRTALILFFAVL